MNRQPLLTAAGITAAAAALIAALPEFGVPLTDGQASALLKLVAVAAPLVVAFVAHHFVTPAAEVVVQRRRGAPRAVAGPASPLPDGTPVGVTAVGPPPG